MTPAWRINTAQPPQIPRSSSSAPSDHHTIVSSRAPQLHQRRKSSPFTALQYNVAATSNTSGPTKPSQNRLIHTRRPAARLCSIELTPAQQGAQDPYSQARRDARTSSITDGGASSGEGAALRAVSARSYARLERPVRRVKARSISMLYRGLLGMSLPWLRK